MLRSHVVLKNIGRGPALNVIVVAEQGHVSMIGGVSLLEPLGAALGGGERSRIGRAQIKLDFDLEMGGRYRITYSDLAGRTHVTEFHVLAGGFRTKFRGAKWRRAKWKFGHEPPDEVYQWDSWAHDHRELLDEE